MKQIELDCMIKRYLVMSLVLVISLSFLGCMSLFSENQGGPKFYKLGQYELKKLLTLLGYSEKFSWSFDRDSTGSMLRLYNWDARTALIISCDGKIKEISLKGQKCWLNDHLEIVAWFNDQRIYFNDKEMPASEKYIYRPEKFGGNYFFRYERLYPEEIEIFSVNSPEQPLIIEEAEVFASTAKLFTKNNKFYLVGNLITDQNVLKFYIYEMKNGILTRINELTLKREGYGSSHLYVDEMSPWNDEVMVLDTYDFPSPSKSFVFNLVTHEKRNLGWSYAPQGFYMQCNILNEVLKKQGYK